MRLVIGIPTFNRATKLQRAIALLRGQIAQSGLQDHVDILVSDNASTDSTASVCANAQAATDGVKIIVHRQERNIGMAANISSLYRMADCDFLWIFSDDDMPLENAVATIYRTLQEVNPDVLLFSFIQPPGSKVRTFNFSEPVHIETDGERCAEVLTAYPKITIYVLRKLDMSPSLMSITEDILSQCHWFGFFAVGLSVFSQVTHPKLAVISEPLAGCDDEFGDSWRFPPPDWKAEAQMARHPFIQKRAPLWGAAAPKRMYNVALSFFWAWRCGSLSIEQSRHPAWWEGMRRLEAEWPWLLRSPGSLFRFFVLKLFPGSLPSRLNRISSELRRMRHSRRTVSLGSRTSEN